MLGLTAFLALIRSPLAGILGSLASVALLGATGVMGVKMIGLHHQVATLTRQTEAVTVQRDRAFADLGTCKTNFTAATTKLAEQNASIQQVAELGRQRVAEAQRQVDIAEHAGSRREAELRRILNSGAIPGQSACDAANTAIDKALRFETR